MKEVIEVKNLSFSFGDHEVLKNVSAKLYEGKFTAILGRNGSGKSTFLKVIAGIIKYKKGEVRIFGKDLRQIKDSERAKIIGYLPQFHTATFPYKVLDVVLTGRAPYVFSMPKKFDIYKSEEALDAVGISHLVDRPYSELSGGERQLVMMARVLAQEPKILLLDEPLTHLDLTNQYHMMELIKNHLSKGITVIAVLHEPNMAFKYADEFILLKRGQIIELSYHFKPWHQDILKELYDIELNTINFNDKAYIIP